MQHCENPLHAQFYADRATVCLATVQDTEQVACKTFRIRLNCAPIASAITPGQFVMLRLADCDDPLLARPLAMYDTAPSLTSDRSQFLDLIYLVSGKFTQRMISSNGQLAELWGPLGNGFPVQTADHLIMVAGGIGFTPFYSLAVEHLGLKRYGSPSRQTTKPKRISFLVGARNREFLEYLDDFDQLGIEIRRSTDDGTQGHHGFVTDLVREALEEPSDLSRQIVCCGPERMMEAVAEIAQHYGVPCQLSLETPMACGIGICFTCVAKVRQAGGGWDYKRTCVEGPVFNAADLVW